MMKYFGHFFAFFLFCSIVPAWGEHSSYDLILQNGKIIDGSGNPWFIGDIGVKEGKIVSIGHFCKNNECNIKRVIDVSGLIVSPGFIDVHVHADKEIEQIYTADNYLFDGVTSIINGNCGFSNTNFKKHFENLHDKLSINMGTLIGLGSVRNVVMGSENREPSEKEQYKMEELINQAMLDGAFGISTGLIYVPGTYSKLSEIIGLAKVAAKYNGIYVSHIRNESEKLFESIEEAISIGREAKIPVQISHFKVMNKKLWNQSSQSIALIENARNHGIDVTVDIYPYTASSTLLDKLLPTWSLADGQGPFIKRLKDPSVRKKISKEMKETIGKIEDNKHLDYAVVASSPWDTSLEGKNISQINKERGKKNTLDEEIQTVLDMMEKGKTFMIYHSMDQRDVDRILQYPFSMVASDGSIVELGKGVPHPRSYGTNARVLSNYIRERKIIRLEDGIRKMTTLPAQRFKIFDRGLLRVGNWADIVVFDEKTVSDTSTFNTPHSYSKGINFVIVNGEIVIENEHHKGTRSGKVLFGPGMVK